MRKPSENRRILYIQKKKKTTTHMLITLIKMAGRSIGVVYSLAVNIINMIIG